jgi:hypothetical protein
LISLISVVDIAHIGHIGIGHIVVDIGHIGQGLDMTEMPKKKEERVEKKVGRLWEAREASPQSIPIESKMHKVWGEASRASHSLA